MVKMIMRMRMVMIKKGWAKKIRMFAGLFVAPLGILAFALYYATGAQDAPLQTIGRLLTIFTLLLYFAAWIVGSRGGENI
jgi:hypothetical protein